jgi:peptide/nickel transport system substrate-binding protein
MPKFYLRLFTILMILAVTLAACGPTATPTETIPEETEVPAPADTQPVETEETATEGEGGGTVVIAMAAAPVSLDPADHRSRESETVIRNMFDGLVTRDNTSGVHLQLAESIDWVDEQTLDIKLREGVKFHDGTEMTADDVVFTFERIINENQIEYPEPHTSPRKGLIAPL